MIQSPLKGLKKPKTLKGLSGLGKKEKTPKLPDLDSGPERIAALTDDELLRVTNALGNEGLAKRVLKMRREKYPDATMPELVALDWLERKRIKHGFQVWLLGGRIKRGGQVVDIVVDLGTRVMIWEVQGTYWHNRPGSMGRDQAQKFALMGLSVWGKKVAGVIALWESRLITPVASRREQVLALALQGIELGK